MISDIRKPKYYWIVWLLLKAKTGAKLEQMLVIYKEDLVVKIQGWQNKTL